MNGENGEVKTETTTPEETVERLENIGAEVLKAATKRDFEAEWAATRAIETERHELYRRDVESNIVHRTLANEANEKNEALYRIDLVHLQKHRDVIERNDLHKVELLGREVKAFERIADSLEKMHGMLSHKQRFQQKKAKKRG